MKANRRLPSRRNSGTARWHSSANKLVDTGPELPLALAQGTGLMVVGDSTSHHRQFSFREAAAGGNPYPHYAWFRAHDPIHVGNPGWPLGHPQIVLFRHADVMRWLKDPRIIRRFTDLPEYQARQEQLNWPRPSAGSFADVSRQFMLFSDPPNHTRLRGLANRAFTQRFASEQRSVIEAIAGELLTSFEQGKGGEGDLLEEFAWPLPMLVMAGILGIPREDLHRFRAWTGVVGATIDTPGESFTAVQERIDDATRELCNYLRSLIQKRRTQPKSDLISRFISAHDDIGDRLTDDELLAMSVLMITSGHETMANILTNGILALMRHRDQWDRLVADPSLIPNAVEEIVRYDSPAQFTGRIAGDDLDMGGVPVPRGSEVLFMLGSANRDEAVWAQPDALRVDRHVGRHMAFGMGIHFCMGAPLARLEIEVALRMLAKVAPGLHLAGPEPEWRPLLHGLKRLDVRLLPQGLA